MILPQSYFVILRQYRKNGSYFPGMKHISVTRYDLNLGQSEPCVFITNIDSSQVDSTHLKKKKSFSFHIFAGIQRCSSASGFTVSITKSGLGSLYSHVVLICIHIISVLSAL